MKLKWIYLYLIIYNNLYYNYMYGFHHFQQSFINWFTDLWAPVANFSPDDITNIRAGGYYTKLVRDKLRIVSLNSNYM